MQESKTIWYGVKIVKGKIVATIFPDRESIPSDHTAAKDTEVCDLMEKIYYGK